MNLVVESTRRDESDDILRHLVHRPPPAYFWSKISVANFSQIEKLLQVQILTTYASIIASFLKFFIFLKVGNTVIDDGREVNEL